MILLIVMLELCGYQRRRGVPTERPIAGTGEFGPARRFFRTRDLLLAFSRCYHNDTSMDD